MVKNNHRIFQKLAFLSFVFLVGFSMVFALGINAPKMLNSIYYELPDGFPAHTIVEENAVSYLTEEGLAYPLSSPPRRPLASAMGMNQRVKPNSL